jgi:hypothetical protein
LGGRPTKGHPDEGLETSGQHRESDCTKQPLKAFFVGVLCLAGIAAIFASADGAGWWPILLGGLAVGTAVASLNAIRLDRNPWWNRARGDRPQHPEKAVIADKVRAFRGKDRDS